MFNSKILDENYQFSVRVGAASEILFRIWISKVIKKTDFITLINPRLIRALHCAVQQKKHEQCVKCASDQNAVGTFKFVPEKKSSCNLTINIL